MAKYYYLVASLPVLDPDTGAKNLDWEDLFADIMANLQDTDRPLIDWLLYQHDIKNLINAIARHQQKLQPHHGFTLPATVPEEIIENYHQNIDELPVFLQKALDEHEDRFAAMNLRQIENLLLQSYLHSGTGNPSGFIARFADFELHLRNILAATHARTQDKDIKEQILDDEETSGPLSKSSSKDFGLADKYEYVTRMVELIQQGEVWKLDDFLDRLRWQVVDNLTTASFFDIDNVLAFIVKLLIVKRRLGLSEERGKARMQTLTEKAINKLEIPIGK